LIIEGGVDATKKQTYINFLKKCGETMWAKGTDKTQVFYASNWESKPTGAVDLTVQLSGMMLIEAVAELKKLNLF
jgi:predicted alpha-1,6-mannanase (GH76 family)